ncbi:hypothetical protein GCM10028818_55000 [Spirosoma horti]
MEKEDLIKFISTGGDIAGAATGGAIGLLGGPFSAIGGSILGVALSKGIAEVAQRLLSSREQKRIAAASTFILTGIREKVDNGFTPRNDGFFTQEEFDRSKANELFEGVMLKCKDAYEEKKIKYLSKIFESVSFDSSISSETANQILSTAQNLTFRKLCLISLAYKNQHSLLGTIQLDDDDYMTSTNGTLNTDTYLIFQDIFELSSNGLVQKSNNSAMLDAGYVVPSFIHTTQLGELYTQVMGLNDIDLQEMEFLSTLTK